MIVGVGSNQYSDFLRRMVYTPSDYYNLPQFDSKTLAAMGFYVYKVSTGRFRHCRSSCNVIN